MFMSLFPCTVTVHRAPGHNRGGGDGDVTPRKDTRKDLGLFFLTFVHHVVLQGGFKKLVRYIPERPGREPACVTDCGGSVVASVVTGPKPVGGVIQPGSWRKAGTHWLSVGKDTGARTSGIVVNAGANLTGGRTGDIV